MPSTAAVAPRPSTLAPSRTHASTDHAPRELAAALWCRRWRMGSSFAARTKSPATSESTGEHGVRSSQRARVAATFQNGVSEGAESESSRARDAWRHEEQYTIVCSAFEMGDKLKLTFTLVDLSSRVQLPTPCSTAEQQGGTFEITTTEVTQRRSATKHRGTPPG